MSRRAARAFAGGIAVTAWAGLALQCWVTYGLVGSIAGTFAVVLRYFTVTTTLLSALVFTRLLLWGPAAAAEWVVAGVAVAELLVGVIYAALLHGLLKLSGGLAVANAMLHYVVPCLVPVFWAACTPKGKLRWTDPLLWAAYPLVYLLLAMERGRRTGSYPYPFLDVGVLGGVTVLWSALGIAAGFLLAGLGMVWLDRWMQGRLRAG